MKVYISPSPSDYAEDGAGSGGIWRIINAMAKWLPKFGVEIVDDIDDCDIAHIHAGALVETDKPIVQSLHGYYWTGDFAWAPEYWQYNSMVIEVSRRASAILSPSEWVAEPVRRDLRKAPYVIPHGVELDLQPAPHEGYVLWGKPRVDTVCRPEVVNKLAEMARDTLFLTTFGRPDVNVKVIGAQPHDKFMDTLSKAVVWLATARETGDIGSREAMLMGVPVLAWDHGATAELVWHKENGYLARVGDYDDLLEGLHYCLANRDRLSKKARETILAYHGWEKAIGQYVDVYRDVLENSVCPVDISIVVPSYNYAHFLPEALDSIKEQSIYDAYPNIRIETIVVDDCSDDATGPLLSDRDVQYIRHDVNKGLPAALNTGHRAANGKYIVNLDADNLLAPDALQLMYEALQSKPWMDVASGMIAIYQKDGNHRPATDWPFGSIDPLQQLNHLNQLPSSSMMRRSSISRVGGYRPRQIKNEDGEFWCRAFSAGIWAEQVTNKPILVYRWHDDNKSKLEGGEDAHDSVLSWNYYFPWATNLSIMPFACTARAPKSSWAVRSYADPHVAVIIPCGPGHEYFLPDALDSVAGQTFQNIECIVANDTGSPLDVAAMGHPWVKVVDTGGRKGPAIARNTAIAAARAPLIIPLDADDMLYPDTVATYYGAWLQNPDSIVYGDCDTEDKPGRRQNYSSGRFSLEHIMSDAIYQDVILFAREWWRLVGGYPTDQPYGFWEDWLFGVKLHIAGFGATYVEGYPWGVYRHWTILDTGARKNDADNAGHGTPEFKQRYDEVIAWIKHKEATMPCRGCRGTATATKLKEATANLPFAVDLSGPDLTVVYEGERAGSFTVNSKAQPGMKVRVSRNRPLTVKPLDAWMATLPGFRLITKEEQSEPEFPETPPVVEIIDVESEPEPVKADLGNGFAEIILPDDLAELPLSQGKIDALKEAGLLTKADVARDISLGAERIRALRGFGDATVRRLSIALT